MLKAQIEIDKRDKMMKMRLTRALTDQEKERIRQIIEADKIKAQEKLDIIKQ